MKEASSQADLKIADNRARMLGNLSTPDLPILSKGQEKQRHNTRDPAPLFLPPLDVGWSLRPLESAYLLLLVSLSILLALDPGLLAVVSPVCGRGFLTVITSAIMRHTLLRLSVSIMLTLLWRIRAD